ESTDGLMLFTQPPSQRDREEQRLRVLKRLSLSKRRSPQENLLRVLHVGPAGQGDHLAVMSE
ncbi:hypothetical protein Asppvi_002053, partial [Aspergillus pseudoviridinutans]